MSSHKPVVLCLQETHFKGDKHHELKNYKVFGKNRRDQLQASGGVATYVLSHYSCSEIPLNTELEAVAVKIQYDIDITICNVYLPNSSPLSIQQLTDLISQLPRPRILLGDFNAHSRAWGNSDSDQRGHTVETFLDSSDLVLLNTGEKTRFNSSTGNFSSIDLSMCDPVIFPRLQWLTEKYLYGSDHLPILITDCNISKITSQPTNRRWNLKQANWSEFAKRMEDSLQFQENFSDVDRSVDFLRSRILNAAETSVGKHSFKRRLPVPWWNLDCQIAIRQSKQAFNKLKRHNNLENLLNFKQLRARARYIIKQSKKRSWEEYTSSVTSSTNLSEVWNKVRRIKGVSTSSKIISLLDDNKTITTDSSIAEVLADHYCLASNTSNYNLKFTQHKQHTESSYLFKERNPHDCLSLPITLEELEDALNLCHSSSPGPDNIQYDFLLHLPAIGKKYLLGLYNLIYETGTFPDSWREAIVIPIHKPGKPRDAAGSYRPISLTCTMCKLLEKILNRRLLWYLESKNLIAPTQSGFRKHRCTLDNIVSLESEVHEAFANKQHLLATFFDIEKAYDMVWRFGVLISLDQWGINGSMLDFIRNFLHNRSIKVKVGDKYSERRYLQNGVPQGSILSVTLFLVAINSVTKIVESPVKASLFADDIAIYLKGKNLYSTSKIMQKTIDSLVAWSDTTGFKFSASKTRCVLFSKRTPNIAPVLKMFEHNLQFVESTRFLGVTFDSKLNWKDHIEQVRISCSKALNLLKVLAGHKWGSDTIVLLRIYKALILSRIDYGSIAYGTASKTDLKKLDTIQSTALRVVLGAFRSSPIPSLLCLAGEMPLEVRRQEQTLVYATRILAHQDNPTSFYVFADRFQETLRNKPMNQVPLYERVKRILTDYNFAFPEIVPHSPPEFPPWQLKPLKINKELENFPKSMYHPDLISSQFDYICESLNNNEFIYTDASKTNSGVGSAIIAGDVIRMFNLPIHSSIFTAELFALLRAVDYAQESTNVKYTICTDSLSSLKALQQMYPSNYLVQLIKDKILLLSQQDKISFIYTPSHVGIKGNETADTYARRAIVSPEAASANITPERDFRSAIKERCTEKWQHQWQSTPSKLREVRPLVRERTHFPQERWQQVLLTRLRIGHCRFTHSFLMTQSDPPLCSVCLTQITVKHVLIECPKYHFQRLNYKIPEDIANTLGNNTDTTSIVNFLKDIHLLYLI